MEVVFSKEILPQLEQELKNTNDDVQIISAFCKESILSFVQERLADSVSKKRLLVRFTLADILGGATDAGIYDLCKKYGWDMYVQFSLHAKTYIFDRKRCLIGSANATNKGIGLAADANIEISALSDIQQEDLAKIDALFSDATKVDDTLYAKMARDIENAPERNNAEIPTWGPDILSEAKDTKISSVFSYEFPEMPFSNDMSRDAIGFLNIDDTTPSQKELKIAFLSSRAYKWLLQVLQQEDNEEIYFGSLTHKLHNAMVSDPPPYRKEVKDLLANLLTWVEIFANQVITVDRPNHSQRIRLI